MRISIERSCRLSKATYELLARNWQINVRSPRSPKIRVYPFVRRDGVANATYLRTQANKKQSHLTPYYANESLNKQPTIVETGFAS